MARYKCPICCHEIPRDLLVFLAHTKAHIIDAIKQQHPDWVEKNGACKKCVKYYEKQMGGK